MTDRLIPIEALPDRLPAHGRLLGLDVGSKTIGLALSDTRRQIASPLETIRRRKLQQDLATLRALLQAHDIQALVIGLPVNMDGSEGPRAQSTRAFVRNIAPHFALPMVFWDERLSTLAAERVMLAADMSRKRRGALIDQMAATYILQGALDRLRHLAAPSQTPS